MNSFPRSKRNRPGIISAVVFVFMLLVVAMVPSPYVIERPGQTFNVMGQVSGSAVISSEDTEIYPSDSRLDILTVSLVGNRSVGPSWLQVLSAWLDPSQSVVPIDEVYPPNLSAEEITAESTAQMESSQQEAVAAALQKLGYETPRTIYVSAVYEDAPASGKLVAGDLITGIAGAKVTDFESLKNRIQDSNGASIEVEILRNGEPSKVSLIPESRDGTWILGVLVGYSYKFPIELELQLGDVGGPSGGMMFALGIIDSLSEGSLAGQHHLAGTGTIDSTGDVGPIGGIRLKMIAAKRAGAELFIGPRENCQDIVGNIPEGLLIAVVENLEDALQVIEQFKSGTQLDSKYSCPIS